SGPLKRLRSHVLAKERCTRMSAGIHPTGCLAGPQDGFLGAQAYRRKLRRLIRLPAVGLILLVIHSASQSLPYVSGSFRSPPPGSCCSESEKLAEAPSSFPHRSRCWRCGEPTPANPHA